MSTDPVSTSTTLTITVNGESRTIQLGATVIDLLEEIGLSSGRVAIERNLEILPRDQWPTTQVQPNDRYEIGNVEGDDDSLLFLSELEELRIAQPSQRRLVGHSKDVMPLPLQRDRHLAADLLVE